MRNFNSVVLVGHLGDKPKMVLSGKTPFATFNLASNRSWKNDGEKYSRTDWFTVVLNNGLAQIAHSFLDQGSKVLVSGELRSHEWISSKDGKRRFKTIIVAKNLEFLSTKSEPVSEAAETLSEFSSTASELADNAMELVEE